MSRMLLGKGHRGHRRDNNNTQRVNRIVQSEADKFFTRFLPEAIRRNPRVKSLYAGRRRWFTKKLNFFLSEYLLKTRLSQQSAEFRRFLITKSARTQNKKYPFTPSLS